MWCEAYFSNWSAFLNSNLSQCWRNVITCRLIFLNLPHHKKEKKISNFFQGGDCLVSKPTTSNMFRQSIYATFSFKFERNPNSSNPKSQVQLHGKYFSSFPDNWLCCIHSLLTLQFQTRCTQWFLLVATKTQVKTKGLWLDSLFLSKGLLNANDSGIWTKGTQH